MDIILHMLSEGMNNVITMPSITLSQSARNASPKSMPCNLPPTTQQSMPAMGSASGAMLSLMRMCRTSFGLCYLL
jgi:hypothetical protein